MSLVRGYLATTGTLFALLALAHVWRVLAEWPLLIQNWEAVAEAGVGLVAAALSVWAWRLFARISRA
jgi:hypothetical protein